MTALHTVDTVVIGAGHAGLAVSRLLTAAGREHVVLDRGRVGERWRTARWDSLHLLTPNWMNRLPGWPSTRRPGCLPVLRGLRQPARAVRRLLRRTCPDRYDRDPPDHRHPPAGTTSARDHGTWRARSVVVATGPHGRPLVPTAVGRTDVRVITSNRYRNPGRLDCGRRPGRGGLCVRGADRRRAGPVRPRRRPGGRAAHPGAASLPRDGPLLVARDDGPARAHHRRGARPRRGSSGAFACSWSAGPAPTRSRARSTWRHSSAEGVRLTGRLQSLDGRTARFGDELAAAHGGRRPAHARAARLHRQVRRPRRPDPRGARTCPPDRRSPSATRRPGSTCARRGSGRSCWPPATAPTTTGSSCRSREAGRDLPPDARRDRRPGRLRRRATLPAPPGLRVHRRGPPRRATPSCTT